MVSLKCSICLAFALAIVLSVESVDPNDRRYTSNRNGVVSKSSTPGKRSSQSAVMSNVGAMSPAYSNGMMTSPVLSNTMPSHQRSPRSIISVLRHLAHYYPYFLEQQSGGIRRRRPPHFHHGRPGHIGHHRGHFPGLGPITLGPI